jgi:CheY-like chemotaxis protein
MDEPLESSWPAKAHDLRHQLALLAVDLRLCRDRLERRESEPHHLFPELLDRLSQGLVRCERILEEGVSAQSPGIDDRSELIQEIWDRFLHAGRLQTETSSIEFSSPWYMPGSEDALHALVLNLLENACKAAPEGPVRLLLDGEGLLLENGGELLSPNLVSMLNEGQAPEGQGKHGRGLGEILARARDLELELRVETRGLTRFRLTRSRGAHILLVEDDDNLRAMLAELLRRDDFQVDEASSFVGLEIDSISWVAAIADLGLPELAGNLGLASIKHLAPSTRTLLLTGARECASEKYEGVDRVIVKPGLALLQNELRGLRKEIR